MLLFRNPAVAGLMIHKSRVAISFLPLSGSDIPLENYVGDFIMLQGSKKSIHTPTDTPKAVKEHYKLLSMMEQIPEFADTKHLCYHIESGFECSYISRVGLERVLRDKNIEAEEIDIKRKTPPKDSTEYDKYLVEAAQEIALFCREHKAAEKWLKKRGYK